MSPVLLAVAPGPYITLQDAGRRGWRRFGVSGAGAMDLISHHFANALVGNPSSTVALEFAHVGGVWEVVAESCRIAVTGGNFLVKADGIVLPCWQSCLLRCGQRFAIEGASDAVWGYLAVAGGFSVAPRLGSCATHLRSGLGGIDGRRVNAGDALPLNTMRAPAKPEYRIAVPGRMANTCCTRATARLLRVRHG
jgi:allophanate hydrolase